MPHSAYLELLDWRRRVAGLFADLRRQPPNADTLGWFRTQKDSLFRDHPQSPIPLPERSSFGGLPYWPHDPAMRVTATLVEAEGVNGPAGGGAETHGQQSAAAGEIAFHRIGHLEFALKGQAVSLAAFWIDGYAGGLFVPFTDATSGHESYGGGRYLLDTIKSADLGSDATADAVVLDFNYAYHPSCAYDSRWVCPLAPPDSRLAMRVEAGEKLR
jgi:hypothetical protein